MAPLIEQNIRAYIIDTFLFGESNNELADADSLLEKGIIDSTGVLELIAFIEATYGIKVKDEELIPDNLDSISNVADFIRRKKAQL